MTILIDVPLMYYETTDPTAHTAYASIVCNIISASVNLVSLSISTNQCYSQHFSMKNEKTIGNNMIGNGLQFQFNRSIMTKYLPAIYLNQTT